MRQARARPELPLAFLCRSLEYGGAERQLILLAEGLAQQGIRVKIISFYRSQDTLPLSQHPNLTIVCLNKKKRWQVGSFVWRLWRQIKGYPVVHSYLTFPNVLIIFLKILSPRMKVIWGIRASTMDWHQYDWLARVLAWLEKVLAPFATGLIVNSWAGLAFLQQHGYHNRQIAVIPNGIDTRRFYPHKDRSVRQAWGIADDHILIGLVGRLDPMKGHATFLRAAQLVLQRLPQARFVCIGNGSKVYQQQMQTLAATLQLEPFLQWHCAVREVEKLYPSLELLCQSSDYGEGTSNVLLEALACGTPCVATDVGDNKIILEGKVVPPRDPEALADAMLAQLEKPAQSRETIAATVVEKFSSEALIRKTLAVLKEWHILDS